MGSGLDFKGEEGAKRWKSRCLVNKCLLGHLEQRDLENFDPKGSASFFPITPSPHSTTATCDDSFFSGQVLSLHSCRQLGGRSKIFPESFVP